MDALPRREELSPLQHRFQDRAWQPGSKSSTGMAGKSGQRKTESLTGGLFSGPRGVPSGGQGGEMAKLFYEMFTGSQFQRSCFLRNTGNTDTPAVPLHLKARKTSGWVSPSWRRWCLEGVSLWLSHWAPIPLFPSLQWCPQPCPAPTLAQGCLACPCSSTPDSEVP